MKIALLIDGQKGTYNILKNTKTLIKNVSNPLIEVLFIKPNKGLLDKIGDSIGLNSDFDFDNHIADCKRICKEELREFKLEFKKLEGDPQELLIDRSKLSDVLILGFRNYVQNPTGKADSNLTRDVLRHSQCPIIVLPREEIEIDTLLFTFDGSDNSIAACRAYNALFSQTNAQKNSRLVYIKDNNDLHLSDFKEIGHYLHHYYENFKIRKIDGDKHHTIYKYSRVKGNVMVILGSFSRTLISESVNESVAEQFFEKEKFPIFVYHR